MKSLKQLCIVILWNNYKSEQINLENKADYRMRTWRRSSKKSRQMKTPTTKKGMAKRQ